GPPRDHRGPGLRHGQQGEELMARHLIALNLLLVAISVAAVIYTVREITSVPAATAVRPRPTPAVTPTASSESALPPWSFGMVASRHPFSPTPPARAPVPPGGAAPAAPGAKANLFRVVLLENPPIAYLEDPSTKRVAGYRQGDT